MEILVKPLSVNKVWQGRRFKTFEYKKYEKDVSCFLKGKKIEGDIELHFKFYIKNDKMSDLDNFIKPILDIIVKNGLIQDDRFVKKIIAEKFHNDEEKIEIDIFKYS